MLRKLRAKLASSVYERTVKLAPPALAVLMIVFTLIPAEVWTPPVNDAVYAGFDPGLLYTSGAGGASVVVSRDAADIEAPPASLATINLATTLLAKLKTSVDVRIVDQGNASEPF